MKKILRFTLRLLLFISLSGGGWYGYHTWQAHQRAEILTVDTVARITAELHLKSVQLKHLDRTEQWKQKTFYAVLSASCVRRHTTPTRFAKSFVYYTRDHERLILLYRHIAKYLRIRQSLLG